MSILAILVLLLLLYYENQKTNNYKIENDKLNEKIEILKQRLKKYEENADTTVDSKTNSMYQKDEIVNTANTNSQSIKLDSEDDKLEKIIEKSKNENSQNEENKNVTRQTIEKNNTYETVNDSHNKEKIRQEELERKNTVILVTGAILIILAAIVFLISTWSILSNVVKTISLFLFIIIFLGASKLSEEKFHLENTSKTFFYMAMAYVPIFLMSISFFSLLGEYLSIKGEGRYIFLTLAFSITAIIYMYFYRKQSNIVLFYGSIISQLTSLVMFALIFSNNIGFIFMLILIYNIGLILFNKIKSNDFINSLITFIEIVSIFYAICSFFYASVYLLGVYLLIAINALITSFNSKDGEIKLIYNNIFNFFMYLTGFYLFFILFKDLDVYLQFIFTIVYSISLYIVGIFLFEKNETNYIGIFNILAIGILCCLSLVTKMDILKPYMIAIIEEILLIIEYNRSKNELKNIYSVLIPITLLFVFADILRCINAIPELYFITAIVYLIIGELISKNKNSELGICFFIISNATLVCSFIYNLHVSNNELDYLILYKLVFLVVYLYYLLKTKNHIFKYLMYIAIGYICVIKYKSEIIGNIGYLAPLFLSCIVILLEGYINKLRDEYSVYFIYFLEAISYLFLFAINVEIRFVIAFLYSIILYIHELMNNQKTVIPVVGLGIVLLLTNNELSVLNLWKIMYIIILSLLNINKPKLSIETLVSGIMLVSFLDNLEIDSYIINSIILMIWTLYNFVFSKNENEADTFKFLSYIAGLLLYCSFIYETDIFGEYMCAYFIGTTIFAILIIKTILNKHISKESIESIEYIVFSLIYLLAIINYLDEIDGMIFVVFLALITVLSFYGKDGKIFITSIGAILINVFLLTREFWFIIPWWMYLMILGIGLLSFAITNESRANKRRIDNKNIIKKIKDKIENN